MATVVVACMCVQSTMFEGTSIMQIQPQGDLLHEAILLVANIGYRVVQSLMLIHTTINSKGRSITWGY